MHVGLAGMVEQSDYSIMALLMETQHLGGIHSGCAVSGVIWITLRTVHVYVNHAVYPNALLAWAVISNLALFITMVSGFPWVRNTHHKSVCPSGLFFFLADMYAVCSSGGIVSWAGVLSSRPVCILSVPAYRTQPTITQGYLFSWAICTMKQRELGT